MKIAILGGGHGCYAAAADLSEAGHEVRLWRRDATSLQAVADSGSIVLKDATGRRARSHRRSRSRTHIGAPGARPAAPHYPLADHYNNDRWMYGDAHKKLHKSGDWREHIDLYTHRYITEDTVLGRDLRQGERTLEALGLATLSPQLLQRRLLEGA